MSAKLEQTSQADMTNSLPDGTHSTSISLFMNSHLARHPIKQPQRFHPYSTGQRLHQNSAKLPKFSHCNLPMETCQELVGEICIGDCPPEINCDGPYASCPDLICTSSNCDELTGKDFCLGPCDTAPCDSNCDWMDWLQCDGTNCSRHRSDVECCCQRNQEQDSNANSSLLMSQEHFGIQSLYPLTPFTSLASTSSTPQSNPSQIRYSIHHQHQDSHILDILAQPPAPCPNTNLSPLSSSLITQLSEGMAQPAPHSDTRSQPQEPLVQERAVCLWGACRDTFATHSELVAHVNYYHLEVPKSDLQSNLFCRWADCQQQQSQIGASNAMREFDFSSLDELAQHLLTDHLGFSLNGSMDPFVAALKQPAQALSPISIQEAPTTTELQVSQTCIPDSISNASADIRESTTCSSSSSPALQLSSTFSSVAQSPSASPLTGGSGDLNHAPIDDDVSTPVACLWAGCTETFRSLEALSAHVEGHVGSGKGEYHCRWDDCDRHGDKAFSSKQKILRHLQVCSSAVDLCNY
ncbi:zinc-finger protein [Tulasnella sp. 418]|nr:zinc-finger protein [Tulasnella sp. 418]